MPTPPRSWPSTTTTSVNRPSAAEVPAGATISAIAAAAVYAAVWIGYKQGWRWLDVVDSVSLRALHQFGLQHPLSVRLWVCVSAVFAPGVVRLVGLLVAVILLWCRRFRTALLVAMSLGLSSLVELAAKDQAHRHRPATKLVHATSSSFPSGHALVTIIGVLAMLVALQSLLGRRGKTIAAIVGAVIVVAVGFARVALNVHHPSDVVAGWALGYAYFLLCLVVTGHGRNRGRQR